jgi:hypothetical protein
MGQLVCPYGSVGQLSGGERNRLHLAKTLTAVGGGAEYNLNSTDPEEELESAWFLNPCS